jgi:16S rRNA processing protein RimM
MLDTYIKAAWLIRPKGVKGQIIAAGADGSSPFVHEGLRVWVVPPLLRGVRETYVTSVSEYVGKVGREGGKRQIIALAGVCDATAAYALKGRYLLALAADVRAANASAWPAAAHQPVPAALSAAPTAWVAATPRAFPAHAQAAILEHTAASIGKTLLDTKRGRIGTIIEERTNNAQALWVVDGPFGEVLVPAVDGLVVASSATEVHMDLPEGLLELNR